MQHCLRKKKKKEPEAIAYLVGTALGLIPSTKIYKYLCGCIHIYFYISILTAPSQHCPHSSTLTQVRNTLGVVLTFYPVEAVSLDASHLYFIHQGSWPASLQAMLSQPPTSPHISMTTDVGYNMQL